MAWEEGQMRRPVVVAVDGSEASLRAAEWAAYEAARRNAPLRIVAAPELPPRMRTSEISPVTVANALRGIAARGLAAAIERVTEVAPGIVVDTGLLAGPPADAVADSGAGAELLVVGARGAGGFAAPMLGSVSRHAATCAPSPVVVVREETAATRREIAVGVRDPDEADAALGFAFEEAALRGANLTAVHAVSWLPFAFSPSAALPLAAATAETEAPARRHLENAVRGWQQKYPEISVAHDVALCRLARMLASLSAHADLVVIGRHDTAGGPEGSSILHAVLGHAHGPIAIVPA
jgi:nucleotide-binding universal stress UspA family protein